MTVDSPFLTDLNFKGKTVSKLQPCKTNATSNESEEESSLIESQESGI